MHFMFFDVVDLDRSERSKAHVQRDFADGDAHVLYFLQEFRREMEACGRCRGGARLVAVDRLVPFLVFQFFLDVRRQRHLADLF